MGVLDTLRKLFKRSRRPEPERPIEKLPPEVEKRGKWKVPEPRLEAPPQTVTVGLDFGTSTTKCVVNFEGMAEGRDRFMALAFPSRGAAHGTLCLPTAVGISGKDLLFGEDAERLSEDRVIRSLKMAIPRIGSAWDHFQSPFMAEDKPGHFTVLGYELSAMDLSLLYVAVILSQLRKQVARHMRGRPYRPCLNMAAPLDQLVQYYEFSKTVGKDKRSKMLLANEVRDTQLSKIYNRLAQWSLRLSERARNPWPIDDALAALEDAKTQPVLPVEKSPAFVVPETLAAVTSYINRPGTRSGRFMTFDVGAGTTDISVFWLQSNQQAVKPWFYASGSLHVGIDDIDRGLAVLTRAYGGNSLRDRREALQQALGLRQYRSECGEVLHRIGEHKRHMFGRGYKKEPSQRNWGGPDGSNLTILMLGGGCRVDLVRELTTVVLWQGVLGPPRSEVLTPNLIREVLLPDGRVVKIDEEQRLSDSSYLLVIAEGLASKIVDIPEYGITTRPFIKRPPIHKEPFAEFFEGHWW